MSNYTKTTNFTAKDSLSTGNPLKIIRGSEHDTEYTNIATAIGTKADTASPALTGTATAVNLTISGALVVGTDTVTTNTATQTLTNKTIALGSNTVSGTTAQFNTALTDGDFATLAGTETLTNKTLTSPTINGGAASHSSLTNTALTSGRVTYATTGGLLTDSANLTFNGTTLTTANDASISGLTVGKGLNAVASNTAVGVSALSANTTGQFNTGIGFEAAKLVTTGTYNTAVGRQALAASTTADYNTAIGAGALALTTGSSNSGLGLGALNQNTTGSSNTAVGMQALNLNTTASNNTAVGYQAGYTNQTGTGLTAVGYQSLKTNTASNNSAFGDSALFSNSTGNLNTSIGKDSLFSNTTGASNTALGHSALVNNTTASNNTAVGYQAGYTNSTGQYNTFVGIGAGYTSNTTGNTLVGRNAGNLVTGAYNTFIGMDTGAAITTGAKNTILGRYDGNTGGLDIRTASNYIVLSDGDGNPTAYRDTNDAWHFGLGGTAGNTSGQLWLNGNNPGAGGGAIIIGQSNGTAVWYAGAYKAIYGGTNTGFLAMNTSGGVYLNGASATSWTSASDERLKENLVPIIDGLSKVVSLRAVIGNYKFDVDKVKKPFLIAQDVQAVLPEAVTSAVQSKDDPTEYLGVAYTEVIPLLVKAIQELNAKVDAQALEIATLKGN